MINILYVCALLQFVTRMHHVNTCYGDRVRILLSTFPEVPVHLIIIDATTNKPD